jgi:hypothetical protein
MIKWLGLMWIGKLDLDLTLDLILGFGFNCGFTTWIWI